MERYALLWLLARRSCCSASRSGAACSSTLAAAVGIFYPPSALFVVAFGFVLVLLLHFSLAVSRLADQNKVLPSGSACCRAPQAAGRRAAARAR